MNLGGIGGNEYPQLKDVADVRPQQSLWLPLMSLRPLHSVLIQKILNGIRCEVGVKVVRT